MVEQQINTNNTMCTANSVEQGFAYWITRVHSVLSAILPNENIPPERLHAAMRYAVLNPGKRLRPILVYVTGQTFSVPLSILDNIAASVECIHAYSLIHDDLPAMDDDCLRRGKPTCHIAFDEATAILAGDALQSFAFSLLSQFPPEQISYEKQCQLVQMLGQATGSQGMAGGQMFDIQSSSVIDDEADLQRLHQMKTGALFRASIMMPASLSSMVDANVMTQLSEFANMIGLGFQICDDILDVTSGSDITGKSSGIDARHQKVTYPSLLGLAKARQRAQACLDACLASLDNIPVDTSALAEVARQMIVRQR